MNPQLIGQGVHGCVYYPGYNCKGRISDTKNVSKLVLDNEITRNEYKVCNSIKKKIKNYDKYFIIQEDMCKISPNIFLSIKTDNCEMPLNKSYIMFHSKYLNSKELADYIQNYEITNLQLLKWFISICKRIRLLQNVNMIHMDMHFSNILVGENMNLHIIDFGLVLNQDEFFKNEKLNLDYLKSKWYESSLSWNSWTLEYNLIGMIIKEKKTITKKLIKTSIEEYYNYNNNIKFLFPNKKKYINISYNFFKKYDTMSSNKIVIDLLKYWKTWDYYKLAIHYTSIVIKYKIKVEPLIDILKIMLDPSPDNRITGKEIKIRMKNIINNEYISKKKNVGVHIPEISMSIKTIIK